MDRGNSVGLGRQVPRAEGLSYVTSDPLIGGGWTRGKRNVFCDLIFPHVELSSRWEGIIARDILCFDT